MFRMPMRRLVIGAVLLLGFFWRLFPSITDETHAATMACTMVSLLGARIEQSTAATVDFDGDGDKEIVIGGSDGILYVIAYDGSSWSLVWARQVTTDLNNAGAPTSCDTTAVSDIRSAPAIEDLDGDGNLEIVVTTGGDPGRSGNPYTAHRNGGVLVYEYNFAWSFSLVPGWPQPKLDIMGGGSGASNPDGCWDGIWSSPVLADLDGDGDLEVIVEGLDRHLHVWHHDGSYVDGWPITRPDIYRGGWSTPAVGDIDKDYQPEIVFATDYKTGGSYQLYAFNSDASILPGFPVQATQNMKSSPALGDIDGDGWLDIVVGTGTYESSGGNKVYAWDHTGNALSGWPKTTGGNMPASPALGDLDNDGDLEVVIGCGFEGDVYPGTCSSLYAWHGDGSAVSGFPMTPSANDGWNPPNGLPYAPILADYDGDDAVEILVLNRWSWGISTVEADGTSNNNPQLITQNTLSSSPVVDDVNNDGQLELIIGGANSAGDKGVVYIWYMVGSESDARPWPMFHHNVTRTGLYEQPPYPPEMVFSNEIRLMHQEGSGSTATQYVYLGNKGEGEIDWNISESITRLDVTPSSGTVIDGTSLRFDVSTNGLGTGWHTLGTVTVNGTFEGEAVEGSPASAPVYLYVGDVFRAYLPLVSRTY